MIGEGTSAKVKLAVDTTNGQNVAIKIIDKQMVMESNLQYQVSLLPFYFTWIIVYLFFWLFIFRKRIGLLPDEGRDSKFKLQVQREIRTMTLLHHPNIVRIHEVYQIFKIIGVALVYALINFHCWTKSPAGDWLKDKNIHSNGICAWRTTFKQSGENQSLYYPWDPNEICGKLLNWHL